MTSPSPSSVPQIDFDALYRGESPAEGVPPMESPPWDTKAPKDNIVAWQEAGLVRGDVLDIGCGLGDNAIYLAQHGHQVTGLDISPTALKTAQQRARAAGVAVTFAVADATKLDGYTDAFNTVIDSGMYHCLDDDGKRSYLTALHRATRPGATLLLGCFSDANVQHDEDPAPIPGVPEQTVRDTMGDTGWDITSLEPATVQGPDGTPIVGIEMHFWLVQAQRR
jgi:SAM-dependent methyltransferase